MKLPITKIINEKVYNIYDFEPYTKKMSERGKWKRKLRCKNKQIRRYINRMLDKIINEQL